MTSGTLTFSDGSKESITIRNTMRPQKIEFPARTTRSVRLTIGLAAGLLSGGSLVGVLSGVRLGFLAFDPGSPESVEKGETSGEKTSTDEGLRRLEAIAANFDIEVKQADGRI